MKAWLEDTDAGPVVHAEGLGLIFDADPENNNKRKMIDDAIELINLTLQREPHGLAAQLYIPKAK
jgi:hypothetical protein